MALANFVSFDQRPRLSGGGLDGLLTCCLQTLLLQHSPRQSPPARLAFYVDLVIAILQAGQRDAAAAERAGDRPVGRPD